MAQYSVYGPWATRPWGSLDQLRREMNALFDRSVGPSPTLRGSGGVFPPTNLYETADAYVLTAELPGLDAGDINVSIEGSTITIDGERKIDPEVYQGASLHRRERQAGSFKRAFSLPTSVEVEKVEAVQKNGVLMLRIPKTPEAQPRHIAVQTS